MSRERPAEISVHERPIAPIFNVDGKVGIMNPKEYVMGGTEIFQRRLRTQREQSNRRFQEDNAGLGPPQ